MEEADEDESTLSGFKKVQEKSSIDGYADGLSDGRDSVFQQGFDAGFEDAFKFSFLLGQYKALEGTTPGLENTSRGLCQICLKPDLIKEDFDVLRKEQQKRNQEREEELVREFGRLTYDVEQAGSSQS